MKKCWYQQYSRGVLCDWYIFELQHLGYVWKILGRGVFCIPHPWAAPKKPIVNGVKGIEVFEQCYHYTAYADDTTFFLNNCIVHLSKKFKLFSDLLRLIPKTTKCESENKFIKSENKRRKKHYNIVSNIQVVLNLLRMRNLTLEKRMVVFKTQAISKIAFLAPLPNILYKL